VDLGYEDKTVGLIWHCKKLMLSRGETKGQKVDQPSQRTTGKIEEI